jgi:DNA adenine methylase
MAGKNIGARPFIRWQGAKCQYLRILTQALPADFANTPDVTYIEPFVGSGSMLFHMLQTYPNITRAVINDNNLDLMRVYNTVRDRASELISELKQIQKQFLSLDETKRAHYFDEAREEFSERLVDGIRHAALFIFLNKTSVGGHGLKYHAARRYDICEEAVLLADSKVLKDVNILCDDFEKTYNEACGNTFFFLDPPCANGSHTPEWSSREHVRLKKFCDLLNFRHFDWMLTGSDCRSKRLSSNGVEQLYSNYDIQRIWTPQAIKATPEQREKQPSELLIRNFQREILSLRNLQCTQLSLAF